MQENPDEIAEGAMHRAVAAIPDEPSTGPINIGDTVDVRTTGPLGRWHGEVLDVTADGTSARVLCIDPRAHGGMSEGLARNVPMNQLTRAGLVEWPWREHDGCDDVDVTGRVRPYHRHAATGEAHAHPGGDLAHTHQTPEQYAAGQVPGRPDDTPTVYHQPTAPGTSVTIEEVPRYLVVCETHGEIGIYETRSDASQKRSGHLVHVHHRSRDAAQ